MEFRTVCDCNYSGHRISLHFGSMKFSWSEKSHFDATLSTSLGVLAPGQEYWSGLPFPPPGDLKKAQTPEVSLETHLLRVAGPGGGES